MQACTVMAPAAEAPIDQREKMDRVAQEYYDSDDIFNYYQQVNYCQGNNIIFKEFCYDGGSNCDPKHFSRTELLN